MEANEHQLEFDLFFDTTVLKAAELVQPHDQAREGQARATLAQTVLKAATIRAAIYETLQRRQELE